MAEIQIRSAFVEDNKGFVLKVAEPHSRKNDQGGYDTVSRTFFDVKVSRDSGINLDQFVKGSRVAVSGQQKTEVREHEGKKYYTLTVWASSINLLSSGGQSRPQQQTPEEPWGTPDVSGAQAGAEGWAVSDVPF